MALLVEVSLLVALFLLSFPVFLLRRRRTLASKELQAPLPPSPRGIPILGNLHQLGTLPHRSLRILADKHGPLMLLHLGPVPTLIVSSAGVVREIAKNHDLIFSSRPPFKVAQTVFYGTTDLAFAPYGEYWRNARKVCVSHLLSPKMVQSFRRIREEEVALLIDNISSHASSVINMSEVLMTFTNDFLCRVVSRRLSSDPGQKKIIRGLVQEISDLVGTFHVGDYVPYLGWLDVLSGLSARDKRNSKGWDDVLEKVMANYVREEDGIEDFVDVLFSLHKEPATNFQLTRDNIKALLALQVFEFISLAPPLLPHADNASVTPPRRRILLTMPPPPQNQLVSRSLHLRTLRTTTSEAASAATSLPCSGAVAQSSDGDSHRRR